MLTRGFRWLTGAVAAGGLVVASEGCSGSNNVTPGGGDSGSDTSTQSHHDSGTVVDASAHADVERHDAQTPVDSGQHDSQTSIDSGLLDSGGHADSGTGDSGRHTDAAADSGAIGAPCTMGEQCGSGSCANGVCCSTACQGTCQACTAALTGGHDGTCGNITAGAAAPTGQCTAASMASCGNDGKCNGGGACEDWPSGTSCVPAACSSSTNMLTTAGTCNGTGTCNPGTTTACGGGLICASATACMTSCTSNAECASVNNTCINPGPTGTCTIGALGAPCTGTSQCASGFCANDVCCNVACTGTCQACTASLTGGMNGTCVSMTPGTPAPAGQCAAAPLCGNTGNCAAGGACQETAAGTSCASCSNGMFMASTCNGTGTCASVVPEACPGGFICASLTACKTACGADSDCASGSDYCLNPGAAGTCVARGAAGATCTTADDCSTGSCVDGFCCNSACTATCMACSAALTGGTNGTCADVTPGSPAPAGQCTAASCGNTGNCAAGGTCQQAANGASCGPGEACSAGACCSVATTFTGFVYDPGDHLPVYNALVYVPIGAVQTPTTGISTALPVCGCTTPPAYASASTAIDGSFTLTNVPSGAAVTVVVQLGKWQRVFSQTVTSCEPNTASNGAFGSHLTLPSTHIEGNIPRFAVDTGAVDSMECVLSKMGISTAEFVDPIIVNDVPTAAGRVHFYQGYIADNAAGTIGGGAIIDDDTPFEDFLTEVASVMDSYDVLLFPCQGAAGSYNAANGFPNTLGNLLTYTGDGGRMFATHFHYDLLQGNGSFSGTANWVANASEWGNYYADPTWNADIDQSFATGLMLAEWLKQPTVVGGTLGVIPVGVIRNDFSSVVAPAQRWLYTAGGGTGGPPANVPIHYTFDTPFNQTPSCGRVAYSDFHVESEETVNGYQNVMFPDECPGGATGAMTQQEKLLEFMLFDLTSCQ